MSCSHSFDAVVIGSGPNGLAAGVRMAQAGRSVLIVEAHDEPGGGARTAELTLPGFKHDVCSAIHPMGLASPYFQTLPLAEHGLEWIHPDIPLAHPFDGGEAAVMYRSVEKTAAQFDPFSARAYRLVFDYLTRHFDELVGDVFTAPGVPRHPVVGAQFGLRVLPAALDAARLWFSDEKARGLLAGNAAHSVMPLDRLLSTNAIGVLLMLAGHAKGWPVAKGGSASIVGALLSYFESLGGKLQTGWNVESIDELPKAKTYLFDTSPSALSRIAGDRLPQSYRDRLGRFRHGPGIFKIDYALDGPVPWTSEVCRRAGTVHVGGTIDEIVVSEREAWEGIHSEKPFVLTAQQSLCDPGRAPEGKHIFWAYCHVPADSTVDMTGAIEAQMERFAPGFKDRVLARHTMNCDDYERYNPNLIGGDIVGGVADWRQLLTRPVVSLKPHTTPAKDIFLCSSSTPPGGGVHGMCGYWAAEAALAV
ncbi:MAG: NAD(P)/FAD-dependent oxidoreductase [Verrucomicrobiales bacterium]|nr:NAD(P)/FAD-dependent oxidoreductase [Verrucomicrobiales bacterium]